MPRPAELQCTWVRERIDPWLDGDLGGGDESLIRRHLDDCAACREELRLARDLRRALRSGLPTLACPPRVTEEVLRRARADVKAANDARSPETAAADSPWRVGWRRLHDWLTVRPAASPVTSWAAVAALLLLVAAVPWVVHTVLSPEGAGRTVGPQQAVQAPDHPVPALTPSGGDAATEYTPEQIAQAERQARLVLAAVAQVSRGAGRAVQDQVFEQGLMRPGPSRRRESRAGRRARRPGAGRPEQEAAMSRSIAMSRSVLLRRARTPALAARLAVAAIVLVLLGLAGGVTAPAVAQSRAQDRPPSPSFKDDPGYVDFEGLGLVDADEVNLRVSLFGPILRLVAEATRQDEPGFSDLLDKLRAIRADLYDVAPDRRAELRRRTTETAHLLERRGWQTVVEVRSQTGDLSYIQTRSDGSTISGLSVMFIEPDGNAGFINIVGDVSPEELGRLGRTFHIEPLERMQSELGPDQQNEKSQHDHQNDRDDPQ